MTVKIYTREHLQLFKVAELEELAGKFSRLLDQAFVPSKSRRRRDPWIEVITAAQELWQERQVSAKAPAPSSDDLAPPAAEQTSLFDTSAYATKSNTIYDVEDGGDWPVSAVKTSPVKSDAWSAIEKGETIPEAPETEGDRALPAPQTEEERAIAPEKSPAADDDDEPIRFTSKPRRNALSKELQGTGSFATAAYSLPDNQDTERVSSTTAERLPSMINCKPFAKEPITRAEAAAALGISEDRICKDPTPTLNCVCVVYLDDQGKKRSQFVSYRRFEFWQDNLKKAIDTASPKTIQAVGERIFQEFINFTRHYHYDFQNELRLALRLKEVSLQAVKEAIAIS